MTKKLSLEEADKLATPGPLQSWIVDETEEDPEQIGLMAANPPQTWCAYVEGYGKEVGAALLKHRWNTHGELVEALEKAIELASMEDDDYYKADDAGEVERVKAVLARAKTVDTP